VCGTPDPLGEVRGTVKGTGWANDILGSRGGASKGVRSTQVSALPLMVSVVVAAYEVILVDSGQDNCVAHVCATFPEVRIVHSEPRLYPGRARNRSVDATQGQYMAFLPDDGVAQPDWLRRRVAKHREGFSVVGGPIKNRTPYHSVGSAGYDFEYSTLIPSKRILARQNIPHCLSYERPYLRGSARSRRIPEPGKARSSTSGA
jgi:glycosyltransferase involved in cell wall biosynthesis